MIAWQAMRRNVPQHGYRRQHVTHHQIRGRTVFKRPMSAPVKSAGSRE